MIHLCGYVTKGMKHLTKFLLPKSILCRVLSQNACGHFLPSYEKKSHSRKSREHKNLIEKFRDCFDYVVSIFSVQNTYYYVIFYLLLMMCPCFVGLVMSGAFSQKKINNLDIIRVSNQILHTKR